MRFFTRIPWQIKLVGLMLFLAIIPGSLISYSITGRLKDEFKSSTNSILQFSSTSISSDISSKVKKSIEVIDLIKKNIEEPTIGPKQKIAFMVSSIENINDMLSIALVVKDNGVYAEAFSAEKKEIRKEGNIVLPVNHSLLKIDLKDLLSENIKLPLITSPVYNREINSWVAWAIVEANVPNLPASYITAQLDLSDIAGDIAKHDLNRMGELFVVDSTGSKFLSSKLLVDLPDGIISDAKTILKGKKKANIINSYSDSNNNYVACLATTDSPSWVVVANIHEEAAYATVHEVFIFFTVFVIISGLLSIIIALLFSRHISKPIIQMAEISSSIAGGKFDAEFDYKAKDSIGLLSNSLARMGKNLKKNFEEIQEQKLQLKDYSKNLEKKVEERTTELNSANQELKKAYKKVLELNEEKNEFLGIAAHDLKNPLIAVSSFADILRDDKDLNQEQQEDFLNEIKKASERMFFIVKNLLDVNAIEQGKIDTALQRISLREVIGELISQSKESYVKKGLNLVDSYECDDCDIYSDYNLTFQVIQNILSNAIKFSPFDKNIYITVQKSKDNKYIQLRIRDEGPGFTENDRKKLFQKFSRLSARPTDGEHSTGLGLSITKKLIEMINGSIELSDENKGGAEFIISFPKADAPV